MGSIWPDEIAAITADDPRLLFSTTRTVLPITWNQFDFHDFGLVYIP
jgi:hypothetical protein